MKEKIHSFYLNYQDGPIELSEILYKIHEKQVQLKQSLPGQIQILLNMRMNKFMKLEEL